MNTLFIVFLGVFPVLILGLGLSQMPIKPLIKAVAMDSCPPSGFPMPFEGSLVTLNNGAKALTVTTTLPEISDEFTFTLGMDKWVNGRWEENIYDIDANLCDYMQKYIPKLFKKLSVDAVPNFEARCPVPAGDYTLTEFQADPDDIDLPSVMFGRFQLHFKMFNADDEEIFCKILIVDITQ